MKAILNKDPVCQWMLGRASAYQFLSTVGCQDESQKPYLRALMRNSSTAAVKRARILMEMKGAV
jgi:hypothetical protein